MTQLETADKDPARAADKSPSASMTVENYQNELWPLIYEDYYREDHLYERPYYLDAARDEGGPILELACGTGLFFYPMLRQGLDVYGLDISRQMLAVLQKKARDDERDEVGRRIFCRDMTNFELPMQFQQIFIPARSFLHAASLDAQLATLRQCYRHLRPGGSLRLNFFTPDLPQIIEAFAKRDDELFDYLKHPQTGERIELRVLRTVRDLPAQRFEVYWRFIMGAAQHSSRMDLRWVFRDEFILMLRLTGFARYKVWSTPSGEVYDSRSPEMFWWAQK